MVFILPFRRVLDVIMNACDGEVLIDDIHKELRDLAAQIAGNSVPTEKFIISKVILGITILVSKVSFSFFSEFNQRPAVLQ